MAWGAHVCEKSPMNPGRFTSQRIALTVDAFLRRDMSSDWIYQESGAVLRGDAERYLAVLAGQSANFDDARLAVVLGSINSNVRYGAIDAESTGLGALRSAIAGRSGIPAELRSLQGNTPHVPSREALQARASSPASFSARFHE